MRKWQAYLIAFVGMAMFFVSIYYIHGILEITKARNSEPNPPGDIVLYQNAPICNCNLTHGLVWNALAVVMTAGIALTSSGLAMLRWVKRKG